MESLGMRIKKAREKKGLSLRNLAVLTGVKFNTINDWEHNKIKPKKDNFLKIISQLNFEFEMEDFFNNEELFLYKVIKQSKYKWFLNILTKCDDEELRSIRLFFKTLKNKSEVKNHGN